MKAFRVQGVGGESPEAAQLWELGCLGLVEEEGAIVAYFDSERELPLEGAWETLPERDYVAEYQAGLGPVRVGRLVVAPSHRAVEVTDGDVVVWLDGDLTSFAADWVVRLAVPLLEDPSIALVKAHAHRPTTMGGGGRTTELVARPLISLYFPELANLHQPLAGEYAVRRTVVEELPFVTGWGVEMALLVDIARAYGAAAIAQVDVGVREHRHRPLESLAAQAAEVAATTLMRAGALAEAHPVLRRADGTELVLNVWERPPLKSG